MSQEITAFTKAKADFKDANQWAAKIGSTYYGGTSGKGEVGRIVDTKVTMTVYHQYSDGATNYHAAPAGMQSALAEVLLEKQAEIIEAALKIMQSRAANAGESAILAHEKLLKEVGLVWHAESDF